MIKKHDEVEVQIEEVIFPNKGVGRCDGSRIVVKNTLPGQKVLARVIKKRNQSIEARKLELLEKAPNEVPFGCDHFQICGGCAYQNISVEDEMKLKESQVLKLLQQEGITDFKYEGIVPSPRSTGYRNKCEFSFGDSGIDGELELGMRKQGSFYEVVTLKDCNIVDEDYLKIIDCIVHYFREKKTPFYHRVRHDGILRYLVVRKGAYTGEILINLVTASEWDFDREEFCQKLLSQSYDGSICGILHTMHDGFADAVVPDKVDILYGRDYFYEKLLGLTFKVSAFSFFQTNSAGAEVLYSIVKDYAGDTKNKVVFDLYCGTGTIGQIMAEQSQKVIGIEIIEEAAEAANENARMNGIHNCQFIAGDVLKKVDELTEQPDIMIVDPPREGIHPKAIQKIIDFQTPQIVYVSCKPTSMAHDLKVFQENGYQIEKVKCVNNFVRTTHVETIVLLSYKKI